LDSIPPAHHSSIRRRPPPASSLTAENLVIPRHFSAVRIRSCPWTACHRSAGAMRSARALFSSKEIQHSLAPPRQPVELNGRVRARVVSVVRGLSVNDPTHQWVSPYRICCDLRKPREPYITLGRRNTSKMSSRRWLSMAKRPTSCQFQCVARALDPSSGTELNRLLCREPASFGSDYRAATEPSAGHCH
jgi:hypothetical protein